QPPLARNSRIGSGQRRRDADDLAITGRHRGVLPASSPNVSWCMPWCITNHRNPPIGERPVGERSVGERMTLSASAAPPASAVAERRARFRELHAAGCFVLPNAWDVGSARYLRSLGFAALASTSAGFAFSRGRPD